MPREEYQVPTASAGAVTSRGATHDVGRHEQRSIMTYLCGDCGGRVSLGKDAVVACPHCAGRVLYKERTKRYVFYNPRFTRAWAMEWRGTSLLTEFVQYGPVRGAIDR